jgi:hypothetical protein
LVLLDKKFIGRIEVNQYRNDLFIADVGLGDGCYSFKFKLNESATRGALLEVISENIVVLSQNI